MRSPMEHFKHDADFFETLKAKGTSEEEISRIKAEDARVRRHVVMSNDIYLAHPSWEASKELTHKAQSLLAGHHRELLQDPATGKIEPTFFEVWKLARAFPFYLIFWREELITGEFE